MRTTLKSAYFGRFFVVARTAKRGIIAPKDAHAPLAGPSRSLDQRLDALDRANRIRVQRAQLKRALKSGATTFDQVLVDPPDYVLTAKVYDMLLSVPRLGRVRAGRLLTQCRISQAKTIGGLSERQRGELVDLFNS